jgi:uncharacterized RDD family membrane protein YckC
LDYLVIALYLVLLTAFGLALNSVFPGGLPALFGNPLTGQLTGFLVVTLPVTLYFALFESSAWQATWGKRQQHLQVIGPQGERLSRMRALSRTALKFVPWELAHTCVWQLSRNAHVPSSVVTAGFVLVWILVGANLVSLLIRPTHQTLYDRLAGTYVVRI